MYSAIASQGLTKLAENGRDVACERHLPLEVVAEPLEVVAERSRKAQPKGSGATCHLRPSCRSSRDRMRSVHMGLPAQKSANCQADGLVAVGRDVPSAAAAIANYSDGRQFRSDFKQCMIPYIFWNACRFGLLCSIRCTILEQLKLPAATLTPVSKEGGSPWE